MGRNPQPGGRKIGEKDKETGSTSVSVSVNRDKSDAFSSLMKEWNLGPTDTVRGLITFYEKYVNAVSTTQDVANHLIDALSAKPNIMKLDASVSVQDAVDAMVLYSQVHLKLSYLLSYLRLDLPADIPTNFALADFARTMTPATNIDDLVSANIFQGPWEKPLHLVVTAIRQSKTLQTYLQGLLDSFHEWEQKMQPVGGIRSMRKRHHGAELVLVNIAFFAVANELASREQPPK